MLKHVAFALGLAGIAATAVWPHTMARAQPAPPVYAYPALYRYDHGRWERSLLFEPGDRVRCVMPFFTPQPGWSFPHGTFRVQRRRVPFYAQPVIFKHSPNRQHGPQGYTIFSVSFRIQGKRWLGQWIAEASITSGPGLIGPELYFSVLPRLPRLFTVPDAIALCRARPALRETITVGGVWGEVTYFQPGQPARGWIADRWTGRGAIPRWWEHGALWLTLPVKADQGSSPPDGFLQVRSLLDCRSHTLTAVARPVFA